VDWEDDMSRDDYSTAPGVNWSTLKALRGGSPRHYRYALDHRDEGDTASRMGLRLIHSLILEPHKVPDEYLVTETRRDVLERRAALANAAPEDIAKPAEKAAYLLLNGHTVEDFTVCEARRGTKAWAAAEADAEVMCLKATDIDAAVALVAEAREGIEAATRTVVTPRQMQAAEAMRDALFEQLPMVAWALSLAQPQEAQSPESRLPSLVQTERRLSWVDEETGLACKGIADIVLPGAVVDLKTVRTTEPGQLLRDIMRMGYHIQGAHYCAGLEAVEGLVPGSVRFGILAVEGNAPHDAALVWLDDITIMYSGETERRQLLRRAAECLSSGRYPGRHPEPIELDAPDYMLADDDEDDDLNADDMD
jgi:hypothetical protein